MKPMMIAGVIGAIIGAIAVLLEQLARPKTIVVKSRTQTLDPQKFADFLGFNGTGR